MSGSPAWESLGERIRSCRACRLGFDRTQAVIYRGARSPDLLFVGEAPGAEEDRLGLPFVGRAGRRLERALTAVGIDVGRAGFVNVLKCRPPGNRFDPAAARACRPHLDAQLGLLRPDLLVPLGARALSALDPTAPRITDCAGALRPGGDRPIFPLLHPAAPLHDPRLRERWQRDLEALGRCVADRSRQGL